MTSQHLSLNSLSEQDRLILLMAISDREPDLTESQLISVQEILDKHPIGEDVSQTTWMSLMQVLMRNSLQNPTTPNLVD